MKRQQPPVEPRPRSLGGAQKWIHLKGSIIYTIGVLESRIGGSIIYHTILYHTMSYYTILYCTILYWLRDPLWILPWLWVDSRTPSSIPAMASCPVAKLTLRRGVKSRHDEPPMENRSFHELRVHIFGSDFGVLLWGILFSPQVGALILEAPICMLVVLSWTWNCGAEVLLVHISHGQNSLHKA